jgi:hypothetical protein
MAEEMGGGKGVFDRPEESGLSIDVTSCWLGGVRDPMRGGGRQKR